MGDKYLELQERLAVVSFITELLSLDDPLKKGVKGDPEARSKVVARIKEAAQSMKDEMLNESPSDPTSQSTSGFTEDETLILKAWCSKMSVRPGVQAILKGGNVATSAPQKKSSKVRILSPMKGDLLNRVGTKGKVVDIEDAQGVVGGTVDSGDSFVVVAAHSIAGYWQCAGVDARGDATGVQFLVHDSCVEWK